MKIIYFQSENVFNHLYICELPDNCVWKSQNFFEYSLLSAFIIH